MPSEGLTSYAVQNLSIRDVTQLRAKKMPCRVRHYKIYAMSAVGVSDLPQIPRECEGWSEDLGASSQGQGIGQSSGTGCQAAPDFFQVLPSGSSSNFGGLAL